MPAETHIVCAHLSIQSLSHWLWLGVDDDKDILTDFKQCISGHNVLIGLNYGLNVIVSL